MHMAIAYRILASCDIDEPDRFLTGMIIPDAATGGNSHFRKSIHMGFRVTYDLEMFRNRYQSQLESDSFYMGYYLHLVQDMLYRDYLQRRLHWKPSRKSIARIHSDYWYLNSYLRKKYDLKMPRIEQIEGIDTLFQNCKFNTDSLSQYIHDDLENDCDANDTALIGPEDIDGYIDLAVKRCVMEIQAIQNGGSTLENILWKNDWTKLLRAVYRRVKRVIPRRIRILMNKFVNN